MGVWKRGGVKTVGSRDKCQGEGGNNKSIAKWRKVGSESAREKKSRG